MKKYVMHADRKTAPSAIVQNIAFKGITLSSIASQRDLIANFAKKFSHRIRI